MILALVNSIIQQRVSTSDLQAQRYQYCTLLGSTVTIAMPMSMPMSMQMQMSMSMSMQIAMTSEESALLHAVV